mgnify:CR=1 FL=1
MELKKYKLGDIAKITMGQSPESKFYNTDGNGIPFLQGCRTFTDYYAKIDTYTLKITKTALKNDILMSVRAPVGTMNFTPSDVCIGRGLASIRATFCEHKFLYYSLLCNYTRFEKQYSGTTFSSISSDELAEFELSLPDISEQKIIAKVLSDIDSKIAVNKKINKELDVMAKELYDYWFVQFDFPGIDDKPYKPYKTSGGKMIFNPILKREIPEGWEVKSINDFCKNYRGVSYDKSDLLNGPEEGVLVLRGNNIEGNTLVYDENVAYVPLSFVEPEQKINKHDIIMTMSSGSKEHVGKCTMFQSDSEHTYGAFMTKFTPKPECPFFAYRSMLSDFFKSKIKYICGGTGINNLTNQTFDEILFPFPPKDVLESFENLLTPIYEKLGKNNDEILKLTTLRDELLPMLMNGQVSVK